MDIKFLFLWLSNIDFPVKLVVFGLFSAVLERRMPCAYEIGDQFPVYEFPNALRCNFSYSTRNRCFQLTKS